MSLFSGKFKHSPMIRFGSETLGATMSVCVNDVDCYKMGSRTYEHALELSKSYGWVYGDTPTIVLTNRNLPIERQNIDFYSGDLNKLVNERLKPNYKNVWHDFIIALKFSS